MNVNKSHVVSFLLGSAFVLLLIVLSSIAFVYHMKRVVSNGHSPLQDVPTLNRHIDYTWAILDSAGTSIPASSFKGKVLVVNVWASWCPACVSELPSLQNLSKLLDTSTALVLAISAEQLNKVVSFKKTHLSVSMPLYVFSEEAPLFFRSRVYPTTLVISQDGDIVYRREAAAKWDDTSFVKELKTLAANMAPRQIR